MDFFVLHWIFGTIKLYCIVWRRKKNFPGPFSGGYCMHADVVAVFFNFNFPIFNLLHFMKCLVADDLNRPVPVNGVTKKERRKNILYNAGYRWCWMIMDDNRPNNNEI